MIFGNQDANQGAAQATDTAASGSFLVSGAGVDPATSGAPLPSDIDDTMAAPATLDQPIVVPQDDGQAPVVSDTSTDDSTPADDSNPTQPSQDDSFSSIIAPADRDIPAVVHASVKSSLVNNRPEPDYDEPEENAAPAPAADVPEELLDLKQQALSDLGPLVDHLDQSPEEKFRTTMMLIQSTDNSALIKDAYVAAQAITDDKIRAQALLDVVNEINYFTQQSTDAENQQ